MEEGEQKFDDIQYSAETRNKHKGTQIRESQILQIYIQVADGVAYIHDRGGMHVNLKMSGIFFDGKNLAKLGDISFVANLELGRCMAQAALSSIASQNPAIVKLNEKMRLCKKETDELQNIFLQIVKINANNRALENCYSTLFINFLLNCEQNSFESPQQIISINSYL